MRTIRNSWERLKPLFEEAIELAADQRAELLHRVAAGDASLGRELAELIDAHDRTESLDAPAIARTTPANASGRSFADNEMLLGRFEIVRFVADGGMGEVYEARDMELGRVALKTIRSDMPGSTGLLARFRREVKLSRRVTDTHVCRVHDLFTVPARGASGPVNFLTMEYLDGLTLAERIGDGPLPLDQARDIARQLCAGLAAIHKAGVIHRDLKSRNIMLRTSPSRHAAAPGLDVAIVDVTIMDLGLACEAEPQDSTLEITGPNAVMGTLAYMAPEQFQGAVPASAADIYSLGVVLYETVTGKRPFTAPTPIAAAVERAKKIPPPSSLRPELPAEWDLVIGRCLEIEPGRRFASAADVAAGLLAPAPSLSPARRKSRLRLGAFSLAAAAAVLVSALAIRGYHAYPQPPADAERWYQIGLEALREGTNHKATQALSRATSLDPDFLLAHASLADAWAELDYTGKAKDEMLKASELESKWRMPALDAKYVDAVRSALTFNFKASLADYRVILSDLPRRDKPYGYLDLGRAYEKTGDIAKAVASYREAARLAPEFPASFVRLGILEARLGDDPEADTSFSHARDLYTAASDLEGVAEVAYQRAYALSLKGDSREANELLAQVLQTARDIHSPQLEIRALSRMSAVAYLADRNDEAAGFAQRAIDLARNNGLDYWVIDGLMRLGNARLMQYDKSEPALQEALRLAHEDQHPRLEAGARLTLASIRNLQGKPDECLAFAQPALDYYRRAGFNVDAMRASVLVIRTERDKADFKAALPHATAALQLAKQSNNASNVLLFEELAGSVLLGTENYADALTHFETALRVARKLDQNVVNEQLFCAETLFRLGRYGESKTMLASIAPEAANRPRVAVAMDRIRAYASASRLDFRSTLDIAGRRAADTRPGMSDDTRAEFRILAALAALESGDRSRAQRDCNSASESAAKLKDRDLIARANLCKARYALATHGSSAVSLAASAYQFFAASGQTESQYFAALTLAKAYRDSGDKSRAHDFSIKVLDMLSASHHNWGNPAAELYAGRPDIRSARAELERFLRD